MQRIHSILLVSALLVVLLFLFGCQSKELTSAKVYIQQEDWDKAEEQLKMAVELYPNDAEAHVLLAEAYGRKGQWADMAKELDATSKIGPQFDDRVKYLRDKHWVQQFNKGVGKVKAGNEAPDAESQKARLKEALDAFKTCPVIDPNRVDAYKNIAFVLIRLDSTEAAMQAYKKVIELDPKDTKTMLQIGALYYDQKEYEKCIEMMDKILAIEPDNIEAISQKAFSYDSMGKSDEALAAYNTALEKNPKNPDIIFNLGRLYYMRKDYPEAIKEFKRVLEISPDDYEATLNIGNAYLSLAEKYLKPLRDGEEMSTAEAEKIKDKAMQQFREAIPYLEKAANMKNDPLVWTNLGVAYVNIGEKEKGEAAFKKGEDVK